MFIKQRPAASHLPPRLRCICLPFTAARSWLVTREALVVFYSFPNLRFSFIQNLTGTVDFLGIKVSTVLVIRCSIRCSISRICIPNFKFVL